MATGAEHCGAEHCEACDLAYTPEAAQTEQWVFIWSEIGQRLLCFCPACAARLPAPSADDSRPAS